MRRPAQIILILALPCLAGRSPAAELPPDLSRIARKGRLVVALLSEDAPPFVFKGRRGEPAGLDVEMARLMGLRLGVGVSFVRRAASYRDLLASVARGEADVALSAIYPSPERGQGVLFSEPYLRLKPSLIVNRVKAASLRGAPTDLKTFNAPGVRIGLYDAGPFDAPARRRFPSSQLRPYNDRAGLMRDLRSGQLTAVYVDTIEEGRWRKLVPDYDLYLLAAHDQGFSFPVAAAVGWRDTHLAAWVDIFLRSARDDGTLDDAVRRWLGTP